MPTSVDYMALESAMHFVSDDLMSEDAARISRASGEIFWLCDLIDEQQPLADDIDDNERYVSVPSQRDLDLGKHLVFEFVASELPEHQDEVKQTFSTKQAPMRASEASSSSSEN